MEIKREHAPELAKGIGPIAGLRHLLQHEHRRNNTEDIYTLTECAHDYRIATDYHINKTPMLTRSLPIWFRIRWIFAV